MSRESTNPPLLSPIVTSHSSQMSSQSPVQATSQSSQVTSQPSQVTSQSCYVPKLSAPVLSPSSRPNPEDQYIFDFDQDKPVVSKTPQSAKGDSKALKRKLNFSPGGASEDEGEKKASTPKRRRSLLAGEGSPNAVPTTPKTPGGTRLTERQQMALLMQMTAGEGHVQGSGSVSGGETSPRPCSPHGSALKRTPLDKKVNKRNERGETPLHVAAIRGDPKQIKRLIKAGADVNVADFAGWTAIHEACNHGWLVIAKQLLKSGANVNVQGMDKDTPLHDAAMNGHRKLVELLLRHGANPLQPNSNGNTPLDVAVNEDIRKLLRNELIASSSSSSSVDEVRSPTSPESNASDKADDSSPGILAKKLDKDSSEAVPSLGRYMGQSTSPGTTSGVSSSMGPLLLGIPSSVSSTSHGASLSPGSSFLHTPPHTTMSHPHTTTSRSHTTTSHPHTSSSHPHSTSSHPHTTTSHPHTTASHPHTTTSHPHTATSHPHTTTSTTTTTTTSSSIFKKVHMSRHMDKSSSPRLTIKFQHIKSKEQKRSVSPKRSRVPTTDSQFKSYSVTLGSRPSEYDRPISPTGSSTSQESDLYDPQLEITTYGSKRARHHVSSSIAPLGGSKIGHGQPDSQVNINQGEGQQKIKGYVDNQDPGHCSDSELIMLSQESGPFTPQFEDISDADDDGDHSLLSTLSPKPSSLLSRNHGNQYNIPSSSSGASTSTKHGLSSRGGDVSSSSDVKVATHTSSHSLPVASSMQSLTQRNADVSHTNMVKNTGSSPPGKLSKPDGRKDSPPSSTTSSSQLPASWIQHSQDDRHDAPMSRSSVVQPPKVSHSQVKPGPGASLPKVSSMPQLTKASSGPQSSSSMSKHSPTSIESEKMIKEKQEKLSPKSDPGKSEQMLKTDKDRSHIRPERECERSPKPDRPESRFSPKPHKDTNNKANVKESTSRASPKPERESRDSRESRESRDSRDSPKSDKEGKHPASPKVPPLKIILPTKTMASEKVQPSQKAVSSRSSLPYVLNPTQEGEPGSISTVTQSTAAIDPSTTTTSQQHLYSVIMSGDPSSYSVDKSLDIPAGGVPSPADAALCKGRHRSTDRDKPNGDAADSGNASDGGKDKDHDTTCSQVNATLDAANLDNGNGDNMNIDNGSGDNGNVDNILGDDDKESSRDSNSSGDRKDDGQIERRITRSAMRSQQQQKGKEPVIKDKEEPSSSREVPDESTGVSTRATPQTNNKPEPSEESHIHPRKRKLRQRQQDAEQTTSPPIPPPQHMEKPTNPYELYLDIRKTISSRHKRWFVVQPKAPHGFHDYLMVSCNYLIKGNSDASRLSIPKQTAPSSLSPPMSDLFQEQEKARYKLQLQHNIEQEKLILSIEQEILRVHGRAARALANQSIPLSVCAILRDQDVYNTIDPTTEDRDKNIRSRYNGRQFFSWLRDVDDKYEKIKEALLLRHHHEVESLNAVQKLEWEWKLREVSVDTSEHPAIDDVHVPMVPVNDDFDLLPS